MYCYTPSEVETFYLKQLSNKCVGVTYKKKTTLKFLELNLFKPFSFSLVVHASSYYITRAQFHFFDKISLSLGIPPFKEHEIQGLPRIFKDLGNSVSAQKGEVCWLKKMMFVTCHF